MRRAWTGYWLNVIYLAVVFVGLDVLPSAVLAQEAVPQAAPSTAPVQSADPGTSGMEGALTELSLSDLEERVKRALAAAEAALVSEEVRLDELAARNSRRGLSDGGPSIAQAAANIRLWERRIRGLKRDHRDLLEALNGVMVSVASDIAGLAQRLSAQREQGEQWRAEQEGAEQAWTEAEGDGPERAPQQADRPPERDYAVGHVFQDCLDCPKLIVVPPGRFDMGSPDSETGRDSDEGPVHQVTIGYRLAVGVYEVTRAEFGRFVSATNRVMGSSCSTWWSGRWWKKSGNSWQNPGFLQAEDHPVVCVSWNDANAYARWLSQETGERYRLLSESEWEYVARAGTRAARFWDESDSDQCDYANGADASTDLRWRAGCNDGFAETSPVGSYESNVFGLHDVLGNVWEWVEDCWNETYSGAPSTGRAWQRGDCDLRVVRGGSWDYRPQGLRFANRYGDAAGLRGNIYGFRVVRMLAR